MRRPMLHPEDWTIFPKEKELLANRTAHGRFGFAVLLKFFQANGRFPEDSGEIRKEVLALIAEQLELPVEAWGELDWEGRTIKRFRAEIRQHCGFREVTLADFSEFRLWLIKDVIPQEHREDRLRESLLKRCRELKIEPPALDHAGRLIQSALQEHDTNFCGGLILRLNDTAMARMDALLQPGAAPEGEVEWTPWQNLKGEPGKAGIESVKEAALRLAAVCEIDLPAELFKDVPAKLVERFARQATWKNRMKCAAMQDL